MEKRFHRIITKLFKQHSKYFGQLLFHLQKPTALIVRVFCYHLQIIIIFLLDKEKINSSDLSAFFAALQQATYQNNLSIYYDGYKDFTVTVSACNRENIKRLKTYIYTPICFIMQLTAPSFNVSFTPFRHFDGFQMSCKPDQHSRSSQNMLSHMSQKI